jgi:adenylate cyclase
MAVLIYDAGGPAERRYPLRPGLSTIGRARDNDVVIGHSKVSRRHAEIVLVAGRAYFKDLGSSNRSHVNGEPVVLAELADGDEIRCGGALLRFSAAPDPTPMDPTDSEASGRADCPGERPEPARCMPGQPASTGLHAEAGDERSVILMPARPSAERALAKLEILLEIGTRLSAPGDVDGLMERALSLLFEYMAVDRAMILLPDADGRLQPRTLRTRPGIDADIGFYSQRIVDTALAQRRAVLTADAGVDTRFGGSESVIAQSIHASVCVPLTLRGDAAGALYADNLSLGHVYSNEDAQFLAAVAAQIAVALDNARLFERMREEAVYRSRLERFFPEAVSRHLREDDMLAVASTEITALFCDIAGYTALCSTLAPERVIVMLRRYFQLMVEEIVFPFGGTLEKYIGDALLAVWGAPYRRADDADRAVRAAVEMQRAVTRFNAEWAAQGNAPIAIHIGIDTGPAAAGNIGSERMLQYAAIGDTTNRASRICSAASAGEILVAERTVAALKDAHHLLEPLAPVTVKGKAAPLQLCRLCWREQS